MPLEEGGSRPPEAGVPPHVRQRLVIDEFENGYVIYSQWPRSLGVDDGPGEIVAASPGGDVYREQRLTRDLLYAVVESLCRWGSKYQPRVHVVIKDPEGKEIEIGEMGIHQPTKNTD